MKVITLWQPWATLVILGHKKIETRSWIPMNEDSLRRMREDGLLIHAAKRNDYSQLGTEFKLLYNQIRNEDPRLPEGDLLPSGIIGKVNLIETFEFGARLPQGYAPAKCINGVHEIDKIWNLDPRELAFGDYTAGRFGWILDNPIAYPDPIPHRGRQRITNFPMCKICGCWELDACTSPTHGNCGWVAEDLCTHCANKIPDAMRYSKMKSR